MSNTATINRGGDLLSLTAQRGGTVLVSLHSVNPAGHLTGLSVPGAQLRAALDEVAPAGSYTRTDEDWKARAEKAERERDEMRDAWEGAVESVKEANSLINALRAAESRPFTPDDITDEMVRRALDTNGQKRSEVNSLTGRTMRTILTAALTEPTRPEGAEELARLIATSDVGEWDCGDLADALLATGRVRVVTEEER